MIRFDELRDELDSGNLKFDGQIRNEAFLIKLGSNIQTFSSRLGGIIDPFDRQSVADAYGAALTEWQWFDLRSKEFVLCSSAESITFDTNHFGVLSTLSHTARLGLMATPSSFIVDPGFSGRLTLELGNWAPATIRLWKNMPIAKLVVLRCDTVSSRGTEDSARPRFYYGNDAELRSRFFEEFSSTEKGV